MQPLYMSMLREVVIKRRGRGYLLRMHPWVRLHFLGGDEV